MCASREKRRYIKLSWLLVLFFIYPQLGWTEESTEESAEESAKQILSCCQCLEDHPAIIWLGSNPNLTFEQLAAYAGPILAFTSDEPLLKGKKGKDILLPEAFPFEPSPDAPVVYYRVRNILTDDEDLEPYTPDESSVNRSVFHLDKINAIDLDFFFYYTSEEGVGWHPHDVESVELKLEVIRNTDPDCQYCLYAIRIDRIVAKAHGIAWYDNTLVLEEGQEVSLPITVFVEEGKHASAPDRNADGIYSPGYDVNRRINDAWGMRDVIRSGSLITGDYQAWMFKPRLPNYVVVPPLPKDSPLYSEFIEDDRNLINKAVYQIRPFPSAEPARDDKGLFEKIDEKGHPEWPDLIDSGPEHVARYFEHEPFLKSVGVAYQYDGASRISFTIPLLIVKNVEIPIIGGWLVHRPYVQVTRLRNFGYTVLYTPSASRWIDPYLAMGAQNNSSGRGVDDWDFVFETGIKFRFNLGNTFMKPITKITTDFWGFRFGVRNFDFPDINRLTYVIEFGAGVW